MFGTFAGRLLLMASGLLLLVACRPITADRVQSVAPAAPAAATELALSPAESSIADTARTTLAETLNASPDAIVVTAVEAVEWPDAGLGCPQPDMVYAAVITPGYRVTLEVDGAAYAVHTDASGSQVVVCQQ